MNPITVVGGGLAGLSLGLGLRRRGVPVAVIEAGRYPRHRVCGEFLSGRGVAVLEALGLAPGLFRAGALEARTVRFCMGTRQTPPRELPSPAWSVSRWTLDAALAGAFEAAGGELRCGERWRESGTVPGVVRATGRRPHAVGRKWRWFGLKAHARGVELGSDLEMHLREDSYVGVSRLADGEVNVCGLFRRPVVSATPPPPWPDALRGPPGRPLYERLRRAEFDPASFCSVAGLGFGPTLAPGRGDCSIGDALTMTPPVTGNGMSMALEAAALAADPLERFSRGQSTWDTTRSEIASLSERGFRRRLRWAGYLHRAVFAAPNRGWLACVLAGSRPLWNLVFCVTR